jgi:hypothetical protein
LEVKKRKRFDRVEKTGVEFEALLNFETESAFSKQSEKSLK